MNTWLVLHYIFLLVFIFQNYAHEIAEEEEERISKEKKLEKAMSLPKGVNYVTADEKQAELEQGFFEESSSDEGESEDDNEPIPKKPSNKPKTLKQKKRALANKLAELERQAAKQMSKKERIQFANIKKIIKEMDEKDSEIKKKTKTRAVEKMMDKLIKRKKLGRGEFEKYEEPVLLTSELKGSLRLAKTEGSLLQGNCISKLFDLEIIILNLSTCRAIQELPREKHVTSCGSPRHQTPSETSGEQVRGEAGQSHGYSNFKSYLDILASLFLLSFQELIKKISEQRISKY